MARHHRRNAHDLGSGVIHNLNTATLTTLTNSGSIHRQQRRHHDLVGTITNTGSILINSTGSFTDLLISGDVTLTGGGIVTLANADRVRGSGILAGPT